MAAKRIAEYPRDEFFDNGRMLRRALDQWVGNRAVRHYNQRGISIEERKILLPDDISPIIVPPVLKKLRGKLGFSAPPANDVPLIG
jgi:hypothetical protein